VSSPYGAGRGLERAAFALVVASAVTFGLFYLMQSLIAGGQRGGGERVTRAPIELLRVERESDLETRRRLARPEAPEKPPPLPPLETAPPRPPSTRAEIGGANLAPSFDLAGGPGLAAASDADVMPLVRVPPQYPPRAQARGLEGWVLLEFTITAAGAVEEITVVDADPPNVFNRAARRAVEKWKYRPRVVDGKPMARSGVQTVISFEIED
jgi:protein TonB